MPARVAMTAGVLVVGAWVSPASAASCSDHATQADAQRAADTRDADGDGRFCESLPCPCLAPGKAPRGPAPAPSPHSPGQAWRAAGNPPGCTRPQGVVPIGFSRTRYPTVRRHTERAVARDWPEVLVLNRHEAESRRRRLLRGPSTRPGFDRDEYPPAIGRGRGKGLVRGEGSPRGWLADVAYIPSSENRSHGARLGIKLRRFCNGTRFRYVFY